MIKVVMAVLSILTVASVVGACPNIDGTYVISDDVVIKYEQNGCESLTRTMGTIEPDGTLKLFLDSDKFQLDGTPLCHPNNKCETVTATKVAINFSLNFNGGVRTDEHGDCNQSSYSLSTNENSALKTIFQVNHCSDGFAGVTTKTFQKY